MWPAKHFATTTLDAETGELRLFDAAPGASLVDAVAASCAVPMIWPAATIQGRRYVDGGRRSFENADLIVGARRVVVLSPSGANAPSLRGTSLRNEVDGLEANGARVAVIEPDAAARAAIGVNPLDPATRTPCADAGRAQGRHEAARMRALLR
jgi:NTE family protein